MFLPQSIAQWNPRSLDHENQCPLYLFWMKRQIKLGVELDYERGLQLLKSLIETGTTESKLYIKGLVKTEETPYIGLRRKTSYLAYKS